MPGSLPSMPNERRLRTSPNHCRRCRRGTRPRTPTRRCTHDGFGWSAFFRTVGRHRGSGANRTDASWRSGSEERATIGWPVGAMTGHAPVGIPRMGCLSAPISLPVAPQSSEAGADVWQASTRGRPFRPEPRQNLTSCVREFQPTQGRVLSDLSTEADLICQIEPRQRRRGVRADMILFTASCRRLRHQRW